MEVSSNAYICQQQHVHVSSNACMSAATHACHQQHMHVSSNTCMSYACQQHSEFTQCDTIVQILWWGRGLPQIVPLQVPITGEGLGAVSSLFFINKSTIDRVQNAFSNNKQAETQRRFCYVTFAKSLLVFDFILRLILGAPRHCAGTCI